MQRVIDLGEPGGSARPAFAARCATGSGSRRDVLGEDAHERLALERQRAGRTPRT